MRQNRRIVYGTWNRKPVTILISYKTPVAVDLGDGHYVVTDKYYSATTARHIRTFVGGGSGIPAGQEVVDQIYRTGALHDQAKG